MKPTDTQIQTQAHTGHCCLWCEFICGCTRAFDGVVLLRHETEGERQQPPHARVCTPRPLEHLHRRKMERGGCVCVSQGGKKCKCIETSTRACVSRYMCVWCNLESHACCTPQSKQQQGRGGCAYALDNDGAVGLWEKQRVLPRCICSVLRCRSQHAHLIVAVFLQHNQATDNTQTQTQTRTPQRTQKRVEWRRKRKSG